MKDTTTHAPTNKPTQNQFTNYELEQIKGMAKVICGNNRECKNCVHNFATKECGCLFYAKRLFNENYRKQSEWISVDERLPGVTGNYICCVKDRNGNSWTIPVCWSLEMKTWFGKLGELKNSVTHWMPLPEPPKRGE